MSGHPLKLLVIEDDSADFRLLTRYLERQGLSFEARRVAHADELQVALEEDGWGLILTDYTLPDIDIRKKLDWIKSRVPEVPVMMVSGTIGEELAVDLLKAGVEDFVSKQNLARLMPAIQRALAAVVMRREKQAAEAELALHDRALAAASNGIFIARVGGGMPVVYVNPACEEISGYTAAEITGHGCQFLQEQDLTRLKAMGKGRTTPVVSRSLRKDGTPYWYRLSVAPVKDVDGQVTHFVGIHEDITEQRSNEEKLRQSATVFEHAAEGIFITDTDTRILDVNQAFTEILGYPPEEVIGRKPSMWRSGRHDEEFYRTLWHSLETTGQWRGEIWNRRRNGAILPEWMTISTVTDATGRLSHYVAMFSDISNLKRSERQLEYLAHHDALTDLPNRLLFNARLYHALEHARRSQRVLAVLFLDLDRFKTINDSLGHAAGDVLLKKVAARLQYCVREEDTTARFGGDEFTLLMEDIQGPADAAVVAEKILAGFAEPFMVDQRELCITPSIGISLYPQDGEDGDTLLRNADAAMYQAKDQGRNSYAFYARGLTSHTLEQVVMENALRKALWRDELRLVFQPQVELESGRLIGVEALLRWEHPDMGLLTPDRFISLADETGLIVPMGEWVLQRACAQGRAWLDAGLAFGRVAVNVAGRQLQRGGLVAVTEQALRESGLPAEHLELEVTETFVMKDAEQSIGLFETLRQLGVTVAIDDFGTGYSSLAYLKRLPIDRVKIDRSFVRDIPGDSDDVAISRAIIALGESLHLEIIAEGVETQAQRDFLLSEGCLLGQGYFYDRPLSADGIISRYAPR